MALSVKLALDESNHGRDPEIFVGVFSIHPSDVTVKKTKGRRRMSQADLHDFFLRRGRFFTALSAPNSFLQKNRSPLMQALPHIVKYCPQYSEGIELDLQFDGEVRDISRSFSVIKQEDMKVVGARHFPKSKSEDFDYTPLLEVADSLANYTKRTYKDKPSEISFIRAGGVLF